MPVIDLKDYLGMPQQAPAQPVFQATTQNVDPMALRAADPYSSDAFLANVEARQRLAGLQRLAPVFQAQQAQLAYDQVAEQARQLRQKQEIEAQVQRATEEITQGAIDPESDQFNQQALQFYGRNQLAFLDPRMKEAMNFLSNQNQQYEEARRARAEAEIKTQEDTRRRYLSALEGGELMPQEIPAGATQEQLAFLQGRAKRRKEETELERKQREAAEQDRKSAMAWAGKRGVPTDLVNLMPDSASIYQLGSAYGGARGTSAAGGPVIKLYEDKLQALKARADALSAMADETDDDKARETLLKQASDASQQFIDTNAEFIQKLDELNVTGGGAAAGAAPTFTLPNYPYSREFRAGFEAAAGGVPAAVGGQFTVPGLTPPPAGGAAAPAPTSFRDTIAQLSGGAKPAGGGAPVIPDLTPEERIQGIDVIKNDPDALLQATRSPQRSEKEKNEALAHLKKFVESPKFPFGTTTREANSRISNLMEQIKEAERNVRMIPELEAYRKAWTEEKKDMELKIKDFAKSRGLDFDLTLADLAKEEPASNDPGEIFTVRDQFEEFLNKEYDPGPIPRALGIGQLNSPVGRLMKFKDSEFAKEFGWWQPIPLFRLHIERGDVLDAYLAEKFPKQGDNQGQSINDAANTVANITTEAEFDKLPIGSKFRFGNGEIRTKERERQK